MVCFDIIVPQSLNGLLFGHKFISKYVELDSVLLDHALLLFYVFLSLLQLLVEGFLVGLEVAYLLALGLVAKTLVLRGFSFPLEVLFLDAVLVELFLQVVVFNSHLVVFLFKLVQFLIKGLLFLKDLLHLLVDVGKLNAEFAFLFLALDQEVLSFLSQLLLDDLPLVHLLVVLLFIQLQLAVFSVLVLLCLAQVRLDLVDLVLDDLDVLQVLDLNAVDVSRYLLLFLLIVVLVLNLTRLDVLDFLLKLPLPLLDG